jgi:hypothetical protein
MLGLFKKKLPHCDTLWYDQEDRPRAIKKFSEYGVDDGFVAKFHIALESVNEPG